MQHQHAPPYPPPDIIPTPNPLPSRPNTTFPLRDHPVLAPNFIIVSLFALRLASQLVRSLPFYPEQDSDITWLTAFLTPYATNHALAKIAGKRLDEYQLRYREIVARMKRQPQYPICFMRLNPDRNDNGQRGRDMGDVQRLAIIDFSDAASEWGSLVPLPAREAERMLELATQRSIADF